jgi:hypothetical protein
MASAWHVVYYQSEKGDCELLDFLDSRKEQEQQKIRAWISLLEEKGPQVPRPYADLLRDGIHELRIKLTGNQVRVLYFFCFRDYVVLTHAFTKNTSKVPEEQIKKALKCRDDVLARFKKGESLNDSFPR